MNGSDVRRYALTRLRAGDYLVPSNDMSTMWRVHSYLDGSAFGLIGVRYRERTFWRTVSRPMPALVGRRRGPRGPGEFRYGELLSLEWAGDPWEAPWREADWNLETRAEALDVAFQKERVEAMIREALADPNHPTNLAHLAPAWVDRLRVPVKGS